jgi:alpha-tubulin suppressor-like RCC1 family protein
MDAGPGGTDAGPGGTDAGQPPSNLTYATNPAVFTKGVAITPDVPTTTGGPVSSWSVTPALPQGLTLSTSTGDISGTPTGLSARADYAVTAANAAGSTTASLSITVNDVPPMGLSYATNPATYGVGQLIAPNRPTISGGPVVSWSVSPPLPPDLNLDVGTGILSGVSTVVATTGSYTVTAVNSGGSTQATLVITVNDLAPTGLSYPDNPVVYTVGQTINPDVPVHSGGLVLSWTIEPELPSGLVFDTTTGDISGTPAAVSAAATYQVTAANSGGSTTAMLTLTVNDVPPSGLGYRANPVRFTINQPITPDVPTNSGSAVVSWAIDPALPTGLSFDTATGIVSGTPTVLSQYVQYTVTATNSGGTGTVTLELEVTVAAPSNLTYATNPATYMINQTITPDVPSVGGGPVATWQIGPGLPNGLSFNTATGVISGTPTEFSPPYDYTVTARNAGGAATVTLTLGVDDIPPSGLTYATNPAAYPIWRPIVSNAPSNGGGAVVSWAVSPALPSGLSIDSRSGIISGTPTAIAPLSSYTVTATNSGGSTSATVELEVDPGETAGGPGAVAVGLNFACAVVNGGVQCTGDNGYGQVGDNFTSTTQAPVQVVGLTSGVQAIVAGDTHACALVNGSVMCWGDNTNGRLGNNSSTLSSVPVAVSGLTAGGVEALSAGSNSTRVIVNGSAKCWGANDSGQLGNNSTVDSGVPVQVSGLTSGVQTIATRGSHTCASVNGGVRCWGYNVFGQLGISAGASQSVPVQVTGLTSGVSSVTVGNLHSCALVNGGVQCWGNNSNGGQLGNNSTAFASSSPVQVTGLTSGVQAVAAGAYDTCAILNGTVLCWAYAADGLLGNNSTTSAPVPQLVPTITGGATTLAPGELTTCAIVNGGVQCWGYDTGASGWTNGLQSLVSGENHSCAIVNGGAQCWGWDRYGQLGNNTTTNTPITIPVDVVGLPSGVQALTAGAGHTCALVNGGVQCFGYNAFYQLGNNSTANSAVPVQVIGLTSGVEAISAGWEHTCALVNGGVQCWGQNMYGQLGNNSTVNRSQPVAVSGLTSNVLAIGSGNYQTCAVVGGSVECWGSNSNGQLGNGSTTTSYVPVPVTGSLSGITSIAGGGTSTCFSANGEDFCWGGNADGQLGNASTADHTAPMLVSGLFSGVQAITAGNTHACAIVNGAAQCWGNDASGQLGNNSTVNSSSPVPVQGLTGGVDAIAAGTSHACAVVDGTVWCWGGNNDGQLGNNSTVGSSVPVPLSRWAP